MRRIGYPLCLLAVFVLIGGHWAVLQTAAWTGMLISYSKNGFSEGVSKTFDGKHPCKLCLKVEEGQKKEEQKAPLFKVDKKADKMTLTAEAQIQPPQSSPFFQSLPRNLYYASRADELPTPVPRHTVS